MSDLERVSYKIFEIIDVKKQIDLSELNKELKMINPKELIVLMMKDYVKHSFEAFMFGYIDYWKDFSYEDWKEIIKTVQTDSLALYSLYPFLYRFLRIDININATIDKAVKDMLKPQSCLIWLLRRDYLFFFENSNITLESLKPITEKLISEGAKPVKNLMFKDFPFDSSPFKILDNIYEIPPQLEID